MKTIKSSSEINDLFEHGQRIGTPDVNFIVMRSAEQHDHEGRVAFIAGKKLGNAVWRNRAKRRMRSLCREMGGPFEGYDIAFVARRTINDSDFSLMAKRSIKAFSKHDIPVGKQ